MPINIYKNEFEPLEYLSEDGWELADQIYALEEWLKANAFLAPDKYVADIGYSVRKGALGVGGSGVFTLEMMQTLVAIGMEVYFSEYPWNDD